jgi:hypothetical protein
VEIDGAKAGDFVREACRVEVGLDGANGDD